MYAVEFITEINDRFIEIPEYEKFKNSIVKIIVLKTESEEFINQNLNYIKLDYKKFIHSIHFKVDDGEMTNPFLGIQDVISYSKELREKSWKK